MSNQYHNEKEEEKRGEKEDEKRADRGWEEKWQHNPIRAFFVAAILIWGGIVALIGNFVEWDGWPIFLIGTGVLLLIKAGVRMMPAYRRPARGNFVIGIILLAIGIGFLGGWNWGFVWPVILILIALSIIFGSFSRRR